LSLATRPLPCIPLGLPSHGLPDCLGVT
jgi:hypothetical protein